MLLSYFCQAKYINADKFESLVIEQINRRIFSKDHLINLVRMVNEEVDSTMNSFQDELVHICDTIEDVNRRLERYYLHLVGENAFWLI